MSLIDGADVRQLVAAVRRGDLAAVRAMVAARPELVSIDVAEDDEHRALHHAVLCRQPEIVRFLMQQGADARQGIWPHRAATNAFTLASERGFDDIVAIIEEEERRRPQGSELSQLPAADASTLAEACGRGAGAAIAAGDGEWLRSAHHAGTIGNGNGLVSQAVLVNRADMLKLLLELGLDPDEAGRLENVEEIVPTWGGPLRTCAIAGNLPLAQLLLAHGANPNTRVYAASSALFEAVKRRDDEMIALLESRGARLTPGEVGDLGLVDQAARLLADRDDSRRVAGGEPDVAQDLLWGAIGAPSPEIVTMALAAVGWPRDDGRWHGILENGLYLRADSDRVRHLEGFRIVLDRCDPDVRSRRGATLLHDVAASRGGLTADDRIAYATLLLDRGARFDIRDTLLQSTALGWACRWGRLEMVKLLLERGADPIEAAAEPWATPSAWARKKGHRDIAALLEGMRQV